MKFTQAMNQVSEMERKINEVIESSIGTSVRPESVLAALDSIDLMELSMAIELHFGVEVTGVEIADLGSVQALSRFIESAL